MIDVAPRPRPPDQPGLPSSVQPLLAGLNARNLMAELLDDSTPPSMGYNWVAPAPAELSPLLPGYEVESLLGRGGMGAVYLATETRLRRRVALKLLPLELGFRHDFRQRFEREARVLAQLDHPHIVRLYGMGETDDGHLYLVMEYVEGSHLAALLQEALTAPDRPPGRPVIPWPRIAQIIGQLAEALAHAHAQGLIHRDLKPANVLLSRDGSAKLADFGLARTALQNLAASEKSAFLTQTGQVMGTYEYMAPEQRDGLPSDHRVDIYGLGVLLYQLLTGSLPRGTFEPPSTLAGVGPEVDRLVARALASNPAHRTPTAESFLAELRACPPQGKRALWNHPHTRTAAALMTACGLGAGFWITSLKQPTTPLLATTAATGPLESSAPPAASLRRSFLDHSLRSLPTRPHVFVAESTTTVAQYRRFAQETARPDSPAQWRTRVGDPLSSTLTWHQPGRPVTDDQPVVAVSWQDAHDFCHWLTRSALARGDIVPGQEFRLPMAQERRQGGGGISTTKTTGDSNLVREEWLIDRLPTHPHWHGHVTTATAPDDRGHHSTLTTPLHEAGHSERGFRIVLDEKTPALLASSARLWAVAEAWGGGGATGLPPVQVLVVPENTYVDLSRRPDIQSLEPLKDHRIKAIAAAPRTPLDLSPLAGHPLSWAWFHGPVASLEPLAHCPLRMLTLEEPRGIFPSSPSAPPSLQPLLAQRSLTSLNWNGFDREPDVRLLEFPGLTTFVARGSRLKSLHFLDQARLQRVTLDHTGVRIQAEDAAWSAMDRMDPTPDFFREADELAQAGDFDAALALTTGMAGRLSRHPWYNTQWEDLLNRRLRQWSDWRARGLDDWLQAGPVGPPPGSVAWRGRWFYYQAGDFTRAEALHCAAAWGGRLATLADPEEEAFVRTSVVPQDGGVIRAHLGAWQASPQDGWRWITGEPWTQDANQSLRTNQPGGGFLVFKSGAGRWFSENARDRGLAMLMEWQNPYEDALRREVENRLHGTWLLDDGEIFELQPGGLIGPGPHPSDRWMITDATAGKALLSMEWGRNPLVLTTTADPHQLTVTLPDGSTRSATRHQPAANITHRSRQDPSAPSSTR